MRLSCCVKRFIVFTIISASIFYGVFASAATAPMPSLPTAMPIAKPKIIIPSAPAIHAKGYVLMDADSGQIIAQKNMHVRMPPASLTKMMTLYIGWGALQSGQIHLNDKVLVSKKAWQTGGSRMFIRAGTHVPVNELIQGIIVDSGNDACTALAEHIGGSDSVFVEMMNETAQSLGMNNTHYTDATGLPHPDHYSTPYNIALLARATINNYPQYYHFYKQKWFRYNGIRQPNRNRLLWRDPSVDGLKTGHTDEAGYCLVASAKRHNMRLIAVTMGAPTDEARADDDQALLNYGFRFYQTHKLFKANSSLVSARIWFGEIGKVNFGVSHDIYVTVPIQQYKNLEAKSIIDPSIKAPVKKGEIYGKMQVSLNGKTIMTVPLIALSNDPKGGFWTSIKDHVVLWFKSW